MNDFNLKLADVVLAHAKCWSWDGSCNGNGPLFDILLSCGEVVGLCAADADCTWDVSFSDSYFIAARLVSA